MAAAAHLTGTRAAADPKTAAADQITATADQMAAAADQMAAAAYQTGNPIAQRAADDGIF